MNRKQLLLYAITDRGYLHGISLEQAAEKALQGGATMLQLREKKADEALLREEIAALLPLCRRYGVPLILDDHVELAAETGCDGAHVGQNDMPAAQARRILGPDKILGVTAKTPEQARRAQADGADYLGSGAMFATSTKPEAVSMTPEMLREIVCSVSIPVVAIGGISIGNLRDLRDIGIAGAAVSEAVFAAPDIRTAAMALKAEAWKL